MENTASTNFLLYFDRLIKSHQNMIDIMDTEDKIKLGKRDPLEDINSEEIQSLPCKKSSNGAKKAQEELIKSYLIKDGVAPVDDHVPHRENYRVYTGFGKIYSWVLNQASVEYNSNKFYILQLLENTANKTYSTYFRWGRIGTKGKDSMFEFNINIGAAIAEYESKYQEKAIDGGYEELDIVFDDEKSSEQQEAEMIESLKSTKMNEPIADLIKNIFSIKMFNEQIKEIGYDAKKMPLGKLSQSNLKMGYNILKQILRQIEGNKSDWKDKWTSLSNKFYSFIPHDIGFKKMQSLALYDKKMVEEKLELIEMISNIKIAKKMIDESGASQENIIDKHYKDLKNNITVVDKQCEEYDLVKRYLNTTHGKNHGFKMDLAELYKLERHTETESFNHGVGNRMLLWHGSRLTNYAGILSQGLRIAPPEAPSTGYMFGKGLYFADMASKSGQYCHSHLSDGIGYLLLCDVAVGNPNKLLHAKYDACDLPEGTNSTKGCGKVGPQSRNEVKTEEYIIPMGPESETGVNGSLQYNEYVVYDTKQVQMKYLLKWQFS